MVRHLSLGNGSFLVNLDESLRVRDIYFPYAGQENHVQGTPHRIGIHGEEFSWLEDWSTDPAYMDDTILGDSSASNSEEGLRLEFRDAVECREDIFLREIEVKNQRDRVRTVILFFHQTLSLSGSEVGDTCFYHPEQDAVIHYKRNRYVLAQVSTGLDRGGGDYGIYREGTLEDIEDGELNSNPIAQGDVESGLSQEVGLEPGSSETLYYWVAAGKDLESVLELGEQAGNRARDFLKQTEMCWRGLVGGETGLNLDEEIEDLFKRSVLVVRGQANRNGAITAANDSTNLEFNQDKYGYVWPRDGALAAEAMTEAGYPNLVKPFFDFAEEAITEEGYMMHKYNPDGSLGSSWHPWVDEDGKPQLPIQEDETALTVWALARFFEETGNREILEDKWQSLVKPAAEFMYRFFDEDVHLPKPSYGPWEERRYRSTFTVASVYAGLQAAADIAEEIDENGSKYGERAREIREKGLERLRSEELVRYGRGLKNGELDEGPFAAAVFLRKFGLVDAEDEYFRNTMNAVRYDLAPNTEVGGIARYRGDNYHSVTEDFEEVPGNPWIICTLWVGQELICRAESVQELEEAREYIRWVCENSLDTGLFPEQVDPYTGEGKSVAPLTWSHTTFIETVRMYSDKRDKLQ